ncbi:DUF4097 family beta strand repeat-containing protein [Roseivirga sp.]|uniref:DUF4097 family beta strand repeat-containing protein n=1 Tax=Roseivirga sp. TaxID=1964215 RepID=UPI002B265B91|nr:DUF4097 family beta strand repeat-containing protein [Roseivirga sp.]
MKKVIITLLMVGVAFGLTAQNIKVDPNIKVEVTPDLKMTVGPDFEIDLGAHIEQAMSSIEGMFGMDFGDEEGRWKEKYQQDTEELEIPLSKPGEKGKLQVESHNGTVKVSAYSGPTVKVKMIKYSKKVERESGENGMRLLSSGGFNVQAEERNNIVKVETEGWNNRVDFEIQVPTNFSLDIKTYNNGGIEIEGVNGEHSVESYNGPITLNNVSGSASASTYNGAVKATFKAVTANAPMIFTTYNGDVDLTVPAGTKFSTKMKTSRDIFTDFENFALQKTTPQKSKEANGYKVKYEDWVEGKLNGGGAEVTMETRNGNIYIRKG